MDIVLEMRRTPTSKVRDDCACVQPNYTASADPTSSFGHSGVAWADSMPSREALCYADVDGLFWFIYSPTGLSSLHYCFAIALETLGLIASS